MMPSDHTHILYPTWTSTSSSLASSHEPLAYHRRASTL